MSGTVAVSQHQYRFGPLVVLVRCSEGLCDHVSVDWTGRCIESTGEILGDRGNFGRLIQKQLETGIRCPLEVLRRKSLGEFFGDIADVLSRTNAGDRLTYGEVAEAIDRPGAAQAVGQSLKRNPYPILVPCHRVVRSDGTLGGYGGRTTSLIKPYLLYRERA